MIDKVANRLAVLIKKAPALFSEISEYDMMLKSSPEKWSIKQIIGHLIDSATNNHQRFVRGQFEDHPEIQYDQNMWNEFNFYQEIETKHLIDFWTIYNKQLLLSLIHI